MAPARKYFSILFLFLMGLNTVGYYSFLVMVRNQLTSRVTEKLQSGFNEPGAQMIIKMPLSIPYGADSHEYEPIHGAISFEGTVYQLVKQRLYKDTLYVVCIRDYQTTEASNQIKDFSKTFASESKQPQNSGIKLVISSAKYYFSKINPLESSNSGWAIDCTFAEVANRYRYDSNPPIFHPPKSVS
ncbi:MAG TPA: hypothetical protein VIU12_06105 [Chryseolinea sp.]